MATDYKYNEEFDLVISGGDFAKTNSESQHVECVLIASKGAYKNEPLTGVHAAKWLKAPDTQPQRQRLSREISLQLERDGAKSAQVKVTFGGQLEIKRVIYG